MAAVLLVGCGDHLSDAPLATSRQAIVGGANDLAFGAVVLLGDAQQSWCSGTVVSERTVLTAAHCLMDATPTRVRLGATQTNATSINVVGAAVHPGFAIGQDTVENDLAVLQLAQTAPTQPMPLLREMLLNAPPFVGPPFTFVGYGVNQKDAVGNATGFGTRRVLTLPIRIVGPATVPPPVIAVGQVGPTGFYYRDEGRTTCSGDSGGPGFITRGAVLRLAGVTSYGDSLCQYEGVQARADGLQNAWIQAQIDASEGNGACRSDGACNATCVSTVPAPLGTLRDPDCAERHCGADGVCVVSCHYVDPDCQSLGLNRCGGDGVCQRGCAGAEDPDCAPQTAGAPCEEAADCLSGFCVDGVCCDSACNGGCGVCSKAAGAARDGECAPAPAGQTCRASAGTCDVAEVCDGQAVACPADAYATPGSVCRPSRGRCDVAEACSGQAPTCPPDPAASATCEELGQAPTTEDAAAAEVTLAEVTGTSCASDGAGPAPSPLTLLAALALLRRGRRRTAR